MKKGTIILSIIIIAFIFILIATKERPEPRETTGLVEGILSKCPNKPNCVCSEYVDDKEHYIAPVKISEEITLDTNSLVKGIILDMGGSIQIESENYFSATFTSSFFKFVDDFEVRIDSSQDVVHIRSASRMGYGDLGVNRARAELFKKLFDNEMSAQY